MNEMDRIKEKIKKLCALSKSPNAHEAALALEMAQKLMAEYGIKRNEGGEFEIIEEEVKTNSGEKPPRHEVYLVGKIADAFGCRLAYGGRLLDLLRMTFSYHHTFVGLEHRVKIAAFIAEVLLRKLKKTRTAYVKSLSRVRVRANKIKRADDFCLGWVYTVVAKLHEFTNTPEEQTAIDNYVANLEWGDDLKTISRAAVRNSGINDFANGRRAAADVQIQHGLGGEEAGARLLGVN